MIRYEKSADNDVHVPTRVEQILAEIARYEKEMPEGKDKEHALYELNLSLAAAELEESLGED